MKRLLIISVALFGMAGVAAAQSATQGSAHSRMTTGSIGSSYCSASSDFSDSCSGEPTDTNAGVHYRSPAAQHAAKEAPSSGCKATADFSDNC